MILMTVETSLTVISITLAVLLVVVVCVQIQVLRVLRRLKETLDIVNSYLPNIVANIEETAIRLNKMSEDVGHRMESLSIGANTIKSLFSLKNMASQRGMMGLTLATLGVFPTIKIISRMIKAFFGELGAKK